MNKNIDWHGMVAERERQTTDEWRIWHRGYKRLLAMLERESVHLWCLLPSKEEAPERPVEGATIPFWYGVPEKPKPFWRRWLEPLAFLRRSA